MSDTLLLPAAQQLLACLCDALTDLATPQFPVPGQCCIRVGESVVLDLDENTNECCQGLAYVRIAGFYPTGSPGALFPNPSSDFALSKCAPYAWALQLEMGVFRCITADLITCPEWEVIAAQHMNDAKAMRRALCCFMEPRDGSTVATGTWTPSGRSGGCIGSTWDISVEINNRCEGC